MKTIIFLSSLVFAAACGGKSKGDSMDPCKDPCKDQPQAAMTCDGMADKAAETTMTLAPGYGEEDLAEEHGIMVDQCTSMAWSQEAIDCRAAATSTEENEQCHGMLSEEQQTSFNNAMHAAIFGGMEDGGGEEGMD